MRITDETPYDTRELTEREEHELQGGCPPESGCSVCYPKCLQDIGFGMQCQEDQGHVGPHRWHRPTAFG